MAALLENVTSKMEEDISNDLATVKATGTPRKRKTAPDDTYLITPRRSPRQRKTTSPYFQTPTPRRTPTRKTIKTTSLPLTPQQDIKVEDNLAHHLQRSHGWRDKVLARKSASSTLPTPPTTPSPKKSRSKSRLNSHIPPAPALNLPITPARPTDLARLRARLLAVKPTLIQERVADDPFKLILAVSLLNKTRWQQATPIFWRILERWPTAANLAQVPLEVLTDVLQPLGLQNVRAARLILFSQQYVSSPPSPTALYPLRVDKTYPLTAVAHLAGVGRYAADSWRIYSPSLKGGGAPRGAREILEGLRDPRPSLDDCDDDDDEEGRGEEWEEEEWKSVLPLDKELRWYLIWRWAVEGYKWSPESGRGERIDEAYVDRILPKY